MNLFPGLTRELVEPDPLEKAAGPKHGPVGHKPKTMSAQRRWRRMSARTKATERRKTNVRHRRAWMNNRQAVAVLRSQLEALDKGLASGEEIFLEGSTWAPPRLRPIVRDLEAKFGSVDAAYDKYAAIMAEQAA